MELANNINSTTGILLLAQGSKRYYNMAVNLVKSLWLNHGKLPVALVTDYTVPNKDRKYFTYIIPVNPDYGKGFSQKMRMYEYSPFQSTLFIDVDCLIVSPITTILTSFEDKNLSVLGHILHSGKICGTTVEELQKEFTTLKWVPTFNGGVYYFKKNEVVKKAFDLAIGIFEKRYHELGLHLFNGKPGDEPVMLIAMGAFGFEPVNDQGKGMYTPVGQSGKFEMDILKGYCRFIKHGQKVEPCIMHFGGGYPEAFHYKREMAKLNFFRSTKLPKGICSFLINTLWNSSYMIYVFFYRLLKSIIKRKPMKLFPLLPMFKFE